MPSSLHYLCRTADLGSQLHILAGHEHITSGESRARASREPIKASALVKLATSERRASIIYVSQRISLFSPWREEFSEFSVVDAPSITCGTNYHRKAQPVKDTRVDLRLVGYQQICDDYLQGFTVGSLRAMQSRGEMPAGSITIGRRRLWPRVLVEAWVADLIAKGAA